MDGVDFEIFEPTPFDKKWFSFKHNGPGLRYEIGVAIKNGHIVWAHGGVPPGEYNDLKLASELFVHMMDKGEKCVADKGYNNKKFFITERYASCFPNMKKILARHETINRRLKSWNVLSQRFRHSLHLHPKCFHAIVNLTQIAIENGEFIYDI